jgi:hypothetical protein
MKTSIRFCNNHEVQFISNVENNKSVSATTQLKQ